MGKCWWLVYGLLAQYVAHVELNVLGTCFTETDFMEQIEDLFLAYRPRAQIVAVALSAEIRVTFRSSVPAFAYRGAIAKESAWFTPGREQRRLPPCKPCHQPLPHLEQLLSLRPTLRAIRAQRSCLRAVYVKDVHCLICGTAQLR